jgi:hypothetical protein
MRRTFWVNVVLLLAEAVHSELPVHKGKREGGGRTPSAGFFLW